MTTAAKTPEPVTRKSERNLQCKFTEVEITQFGRDLAHQTIELTALESDKKRVVSDFAAKISSKESDISVLTNKIQSGYEYRMVPVIEHFDQPKPGRKQIVREDTGEVVGTEPMTQADLQTELLTKENEPANGVPAPAPAA